MPYARWKRIHIKKEGLMRKLAIIFTTALFLSLQAFGAEETTGPNPDEALQRLKDGNARFVSGAMTHPNLSKERLKETCDSGQKPIATVLGCSDSREPLELIFDQGVGDIFVVRVAGNVCDTDEIGSIEYGAGHLKTPLVVVLGHTKCGAVTAVVTNTKVGGCIPELVGNIKHSADIAKVANLGGDQDAIILAATKENIFQSIEDLLKRSEEARELVTEGHVKIIGALYHIDDGSIEWIGPHPKEAELLKAHEGKSGAKKEEKKEEKKK
jgi:carbonic anhydrase